MKCENCGKNEVSFVYQSNVNGKITEKHLCQDCAEKLGYTNVMAKMADRSQRMMSSFFDNSFFGSGFGGLMDDFFSPMPSLMGRMNRMLEDPFDDFFDAMPALSAVPVEQQETETAQKDTLVGKEEESRFSRMRHMNALRMEMRKAVRQENFERAAQLRDEIHQLEAEHEQKNKEQ